VFRRVKLVKTRLEGPLLIEPVIHGDERGFFVETFRENVFSSLGIEESWVQDNHSRSRFGILRGIHFQPGMAKLVRCARGSILDVVVDLRRGSPTFGAWEAHELDEGRMHQLYVPDGFGHALFVTSEIADVVYKTSAYYDPESERAIAWDDPDIAVDWPHADPVVSPRDTAAPRLREIEAELPFTL
jgi:dTDP-4-dehydrorhamnose 3,5-epimerase